MEDSLNRSSLVRAISAAPDTTFSRPATPAASAKQGGKHARESQSDHAKPVQPVAVELNSTHFYLLSASIFLPSFLPSWPAWTYCPARHSHSCCLRFSFSLSLPLFLPHPFSPSTPAFPLRFPSPPPLLSLKVFAQSGLAQRGSTSCRSHPKWLPAAMSDASCCESPLLFCHHCALLL